jgi:hypothetical protein
MEGVFSGKKPVWDPLSQSIVNSLDAFTMCNTHHFDCNAICAKKH